jgi:dTDP-3-amino-3,4,6-trideoxy-alpha-D-glucose transaminase
MASPSGANRVELNDFKRQWAELGPALHEALERVGSSGWYILGKEVSSFEAELAPWFGAAHAVGCGNGLDAIEIGLRALGVGKGDKVLTTPLSAFATTLAILKAGAMPVFVDVDGLGLLDTALADERLKRGDIKCVVPVHLYGTSLSSAWLKKVRGSGVLLLEDCAQSIGAKDAGVLTGATGHAAATSFYPTKNLGALGDGGALLTSDAALARRARQLRDYGQAERYVHTVQGLNSRLDELHAAMLRTAMLPRLEAWTQKRTSVAERYRAGIQHPRLAPLSPPSGSAPVWHLFPLLVDGDREALKAHLAARGIGSAVHYPRLITAQAALDGVEHEVVGSLPRANRFAAHELSLPIHPALEDAEVDRVIDACNSWS